MQVPDEAVQVVAEQMLRRYESQYSAEHLTWRDFADDARADLEAAAPALGEGVAREILAYMEGHGPAPASPGVTLHEAMRRAWRRHFGIAARVAAARETTEENDGRD